MRVGVVSDTHMPRFGRSLPAPLVEGLAGVDLILHAGDFTGPEVPGWFERLAPLAAVAGNNDSPKLVEAFGRRKILTVSGVAIGLIHGDGARGTTLARAMEAFAFDPVEVIVVGHSHQPYCEKHGDRWLFNPGSPSDKRRNPRYSYGILEIEDGRVVPRLYDYDRKGPWPG